MDHKGSVASSVDSIVSAFNSGLDVFKRIRDRRKQKREKKNEGKKTPNACHDLQLANSLRKAPLEIQSTYEARHRSLGDKFAHGDAIARSSLATTLLKLNTALASLITSFLSHDHKKPFHFDAKSFTELSNASRADALNALDQLHTRLSQRSQLRLKGPDSDRRQPEQQTKRTHTKRSSNEPRHCRCKRPMEVARVPVKCSSETQLVVIRPRPRRTSSASNSSGHERSKTSSEASTAVNSPCSSPTRVSHDVNSYFPTAAPADRPTKPNAPAPQDSLAKTDKKQRSQPADVDSKPAKFRRKASPPLLEPVTEDVHSNPWIDVEHQQALYHELQLRHQQAMNDKQIARQGYSPAHLPADQSPLPYQSDLPSRRISTLTSSTRVGEVPMSQWDQPFDFDEAARLNEQAHAQGAVPLWMHDLEKNRKGFWSFLQRGRA